MKRESLLPHSQDLATCPYPEPDHSSPRLPIPLLHKSFNIIPHLQLGQNAICEVYYTYLPIQILFVRQ
jgi:hypothetical protein